jgi:hypothetical protein
MNNMCVIQLDERVPALEEEAFDVKNDINKCPLTLDDEAVLVGEGEVGLGFTRPWSIQFTHAKA